MKPTGSIYLRNGRYWWRGKLPGCATYAAIPLKHADQQFATKHRREAEQILADLWREAERATADSPPIAPLVDAFEVEEARKNCPAHLAQKMRGIRAFIADASIRTPVDITTEAAQAWLDALAGRYGPKAIIDRRNYLGVFCRFLRKRKALAGYPIEDTERPSYQPPDGVVLTEQEVEQALQSAARHGVLPEIATAFYTGLRRGTLMKLRWSDYQQHGDGPVIVIPARSIKTKKQHAVPVCAKLSAILEPLAGEPKALMFKKRTPRQWAELLAPIRADVPAFSIKGAGWHVFRRSVATILIAGGSDVLPVSKLLGHSDIRMTAKRYVHLSAAKAARPHVEKL